MIKLAVVDDEKAFAEDMKTKLSVELEVFGTAAEIVLYGSGEEFAERADDYDAVFLDVDMPRMSGGQVAEKIRGSNSRLLIVFVTGHDDFVFSSIAFSPFRFIRKSFLSSELHECVKALVDQIEKMSVKLCFETEKGNLYLKPADILYFEVFNHTVTVHTAEGSSVIRSTLSEIEKSISEKGFIRTHKSYLVNYRYIFSLDEFEAVLDNKEKVPLSRRKREEAKKKLLYFSRKIG